MLNGLVNSKSRKNYIHRQYSTKCINKDIIKYVNYLQSLSKKL